MSAACVLLLLAVGDVESGPKAGEAVPKLPVFAVAGTVEGKQLDFAAERKDAPTVYLFVTAEKFSRPMARFMREIDGKLAETAEKAEAVAVWVGGEADKNKEFLPRAQMSLKFAHTALTVSEAASPDGWGINGDAHLTAVVAVGGKVVKSFPFVSVNETDAPAVLDALKKAAKK